MTIYMDRYKYPYTIIRTLNHKYVHKGLWQGSLPDLRYYGVIVTRVGRGSRTKDYGRRLLSLVVRNHFTYQYPDPVPYVFYSDRTEQNTMVFHSYTSHFFWYFQTGFLCLLLTFSRLISFDLVQHVVLFDIT